jgi:hypothetical protein
LTSFESTLTKKQNLFKENTFAPGGGHKCRYPPPHRHYAARCSAVTARKHRLEQITSDKYPRKEKKKSNLFSKTTYTIPKYKYERLNKFAQPLRIDCVFEHIGSEKGARKKKHGFLLGKVSHKTFSNLCEARVVKQEPFGKVDHVR